MNIAQPWVNGGTMGALRPGPTPYEYNAMRRVISMTLRHRAAEYLCMCVRMSKAGRPIGGGVHLLLYSIRYVQGRTQGGGAPPLGT